MARGRRRKGNPLLAKIVVATLAAHAIALPILAHFGAFKEIQRQFGTSRVVMVTMPPLEKPKPIEKAPKKKAAPVRKAPGGAPKATATSRANVPQPKVVASAAAGEGGSGGRATVDANGTGVAGALPAGAAATKPVEKPSEPVLPPKAEPKAEPPPAPVEKPPEPAKPVVAPPPAAVKPSPKRIVQAETIDAPQPTIPDDLRTEPFEKTLVVEADVDTVGHPTNVKVAESTGVRELDDAGLSAARRYRFKAAMVDDTPVDQHVRFRIIFKVE